MQDSGLRMADRSGPAFFAQSAPQEEAMMAHGGVSVRKGIIGIEREGAFQEQQRLSHTCWKPGIDVRLSLQDKIIGVEILRTVTFDALGFGPTQARLDCADDR